MQYSFLFISVHASVTSAAHYCAYTYTVVEHAFNKLYYVTDSVIVIGCNSVNIIYAFLQNTVFKQTKMCFQLMIRIINCEHCGLKSKSVCWCALLNY